MHDFLRLGLGFHVNWNIHGLWSAGNEQGGGEAENGEWKEFHSNSRWEWVGDAVDELVHSLLVSVEDSVGAGGVRFGLSTSDSSGLAGL